VLLLASRSEPSMKAKLVSRARMAVSLCIGSIVHARDPLPSWNDTSPKKAIIAFVERWIHDFDVSRRFEGDGFSFTASLKF
jgi:hypothetical protein